MSGSGGIEKANSFNPRLNPDLESNIIGENLSIDFHFFLFSGAFMNYKATEQKGGNFFNSSLPLLSTSEKIKNWPGDYCT